MNIFFDLDGTLTDPGEGIIGCICHALTGLGRPIPTLAVLQNCIGPPLLESFHELLDTHDAVLANEAVALYRQRFSTIGLYENKVYPGIDVCLDTLADAGYRLAVATSKPTVFAERILVHFGLRDRFQAVYGSELDGTRTDKGELIDHALSDSGTERAHSIMIGDRKHDILGAVRNGVVGIGVLWGYGSRMELQAAGAAELVDEVGQLACVLHQYAKEFGVRV